MPRLSSCASWKLVACCSSARSPCQRSCRLLLSAGDRSAQAPWSRPGVHGVVLPVAVLAHHAGLRRLVAAAAVLARVEPDVVARRPAGGEALVARILLVRDGVRPGDELGRHGRLVERYLPQHDAGPVAVAAHQVAAVAVLQLGEGRVGVEVLPAGDAVHDDQAELVARVHERRRVRIVRQAHVVESRVLDPARVPILRRVRQRVADVGMLLVTVGAPQEHRLVVEPEAVPVDRDAADPDAHRLGVHHPAAHQDLAVEPVEVGIRRAPEPGRADGEVLRHLEIRARAERGRLADGVRDAPAIGPAERDPHLDHRRLGTAVPDVRLDPHRGRVAGDVGIGHHHSAAGGPLDEQRLGQRRDGPSRSGTPDDRARDTC